MLKCRLASMLRNSLVIIRPVNAVTNKKGILLKLIMVTGQNSLECRYTGCTY